jgi:hypothetical protein
MVILARSLPPSYCERHGSGWFDVVNLARPTIEVSPKGEEIGLINRTTDRIFAGPLRDCAEELFYEHQKQNARFGGVKSGHTWDNSVPLTIGCLP